ncbi:MFS transporter [Actinomadura syzygii]|uniref:MFS transporter n=1 Tax=Actinomadura syzygii TaxID=1427538 RepID=UPI001CA3628C|nr:MFS transporter [Actinomadura syzygii]
MEITHPTTDGVVHPPRQTVPTRVLVLALGTFAVGTDAFVVAGVLPSIAASLHIGIAAAAQSVTVFCLAYAVLAPVLATLTGAWPRRRALLTGLLVLAAGNAATALAPSYGALLATRLPAAVGAALFTPAAAAAATTLTAPQHRARALSYVLVGLVSATALGVPAGTLLGGMISWRTTMWLSALLAALAAAALALWLPHVPQPPRIGLRTRLAPLGDRRVTALLATTVAISIGNYLFHTYIAVILSPVTGGDTTSLAVLLLVGGLAATAGVLVTAAWADRFGPRRVIAAVTGALAVCLVLAPAAISLGPAVAAVLMAACGFAAWSTTVPQQHRLIAAAPHSAPLAVALNAAAVYASAAMAGGTGGLVLDGFGPTALPWAAAGCVLLGLATSELAHRMTARPSRSQ